MLCAVFFYTHELNNNNNNNNNSDDDDDDDLIKSLHLHMAFCTSSSAYILSWSNSFIEVFAGIRIRMW